MRLLAVGDQHFGQRADIGREPGDRLAEQEAVWRWTLQQAREQQVDAILHAGDWFEHRKPDPQTMLAAERPLVEHRDLGGPAVLSISGNHDLAGTAEDSAVDVLAEAGLVEFVKTPRVVLVDGGCLVACLPWAPTARLAAQAGDVNRDSLNETAAELLVDVARDLFNECDHYARPGAPYPRILLTHFSISGTSLPSGLPVDQLREPVLDQHDLLSIGYDAVIAGHIHRPQLFGDRGLMVGSPMPLSFGEADGLPRGPWIVTLAETGLLADGRSADTPSGLAPVSPSVTFKQQPAPSRRFVNVVDDEVFEGQDVEGAYVKLHVHDTDHDAEALREALLGMGAYRVFVDVQVKRAARARDVTVDDTLDVRESFARWLAAQNGRVDDEIAVRVLDRANGYFERVGT